MLTEEITPSGEAQAPETIRNRGWSRRRARRTAGMHGRKKHTLQDVQKGRSARPQRAKKRGVRLPVRRASEGCEYKAGGLFQHPATAVPAHARSWRHAIGKPSPTRAGRPQGASAAFPHTGQAWMEERSCGLTRARPPGGEDPPVDELYPNPGWSCSACRLSTDDQTEEDRLPARE